METNRPLTVKMNLLAENMSEMTATHINVQGTSRDHQYLAGVVYGGMGNTTVNNVNQHSDLTSIIESSKQLMNSIDNGKHVSTQAERAVYTSLLNSGCVLVSGKSGTGKTTIGLTVMAQIIKTSRRTPVVLNSSDQWDKLQITSGENKTEYVVMIDHIFGPTNFVPSHFNDWEKKFDIMWPLVKSGHLFLILTSRPEVYSQCKQSVKKYNIFQKAEFINLDGDMYALSTGEIKQLVRAYCGEDFTQSELSSIANTNKKYAIGFPLCCKFYSVNVSARKKGLSYLLNPQEGIMSEIDCLKETDPLGFYTLLLVLFKDSCLKSDLLTSQPSDEFKSYLSDVRQFCSLNQIPTMDLLKQKAKQFCGVYLSESQVGFHFQHQSVLDAVVLSISEDYLDRFINVCPCRILHEYVRIQGCEKKTSGKVIFVSKEFFPQLADRLTEIVMSQRTSDIIRHESLSHHSFVEVLVERWLLKDIVNILSLELENKSVIVDTFDVDSLQHYVPYSDLNRMLKMTPLLNFTYLFSHLIMNQSPVLRSLMPCIEKAILSLPRSVQKEALNCAFYTGLSYVTNVLLSNKETLCMSSLHTMAMSQFTDSNLMEQALRDLGSQLQCPKELGKLLSFCVQSGIPKTVTVLVEKIKRLSGCHDIFSNCLIQLLLQSSGEMIKKPQFRRVSSKDIKTLKILFHTGGRYNLTKLICLAAGHDDPSALIFLLDNIPEVNLSHHESVHFAIACQFGSAECVKEFLKRGTDLRLVGTLNKSFRDYRPHLPSTISTVLRCPEDDAYEKLKRTVGLTVTMQSEIENNNFRHLHLSADSRIDSYEKVKVLLSASTKESLQMSGKIRWQSQFQHGVSTQPFDFDMFSEDHFNDAECINSRDLNGSTPLHFASARGNIRTAEVLLEAGAVVTHTDHWGLTPFMCAIFGQNPDIVKLLLRYKPTSSQFDEREILAHTLPAILGIESNEAYCSAFKYYEIVSPTVHSEKFLKIFDILLRGMTATDFVDTKGSSALLKSVLSGNMEAVSFLLSNGAHINRKDPLGQTVLHVSARKQFFALLKLLCEKGADVNIVDEIGNTVLHEAIRSDLETMDKVEYLIKVKNVPLAPNNKGRTALFDAVETADMEVFEYLLQNGFSVSHCDDDGRSVLHVACTVTDPGKINVLKSLFDMETNLLHIDAHGQTPLHIACSVGSLEWAQYLLTKKYSLLTLDNKRRSLLHLAAESGNIGLLQMLLEKEERYQIQDMEGETALHIAAKHDHVALVHLLLSKPITFNRKDFQGRTPLLCAIKDGSEQAASIFIEKGQNIMDQDNDGTSPVHAAVEINSLDIVKQLLKRDIDITVQNKKGQTVVHIAVLRKCSAEENIASGSIIERDTVSSEIEILNLLLEKGAVIHTTDNRKRTALHYAAINDNQRSVPILLDTNISLIEMDEEGNTAIHLAAEAGSVSTLNVLLDHNSDVNRQNSNGRTPLHMATKGNHTECFKLLIQNGSDIEIVDKKGMTPLELGDSEASWKTLLKKSDMTDFSGPCSVHSDEDDDICCLDDPEYFETSRDRHNTFKEEIMTKPQPSYMKEFLGTTICSFLDSDLILTDKDNKGRTAVQKAVVCGTYDSIRVYLANGADPSHRDLQGKTSLHLAVERGDLAIVELLLMHTADITIADNSGNTACDIARQIGMEDIENLLLANLCFVDEQEQKTVDTENSRQSAHRTLPISSSTENVQISFLDTAKLGNVTELRMKLREGIQLPGCDEKGRTALHYAAMRGDSDILQILLLQHALPVSIKDKKGLTPIHIAAKLGRYQNVNLLVDSRADLNVQDNSGFTPLHYAANFGDFDTVRLLAQHGCNTDIKDIEGHTALHITAKLGHIRCVKCLLGMGVDISVLDKDGKTAKCLAKDNNYHKCMSLLSQILDRENV